MKKLVSVLLTVFILSASVMMFAGCDDYSSDLEYNMVFSDVFLYEEAAPMLGEELLSEELTFESITSYSELIKFSDKYGWTFFGEEEDEVNPELPPVDDSEEEDSYYDTDLGEQLRIYDSDYFAENNLVMIFYCNQTFDYMQIVDTTIENKVLNIELLVPDDYFEAFDENLYCVYLVETSGNWFDQVKDVEIINTSSGELCHLKDAYDQGILTDAEIDEIAYSYNNANEVYDGDYEYEIKVAYANYVLGLLIEGGIDHFYYIEDLIDDLYINSESLSPEYTEIVGYYGTYGDYVVVGISGAVAYFFRGDPSNYTNSTFDYDEVNDKNFSIFVWKM